MHSLQFAAVVIIGWLLAGGNPSFAIEPVMVLQLEGISGDSPYEPYPDWIEVLSFHHGIAKVLSNISAPGAHRVFTITKYLDSSSPKLNMYASSGQSIPQSTFVYLDGMGFMETYKFKKVVIASVSISADEDEQPVETVSFHYNEIHWLLSSYDPPFGTPRYSVESWWNVPLNKGDLTTFPPGTTEPPATGFPPDSSLLEWSLY